MIKTLSITINSINSINYYSINYYQFYQLLSILSITNRDVLKFFKNLPIASVDSVIFSKYFKAFLAHVHTKHDFFVSELIHLS
jgi:hypothetical protein